MPEQRCPMCGKLNSPEADLCQFCQARLKPIENPPSSADWLSGLITGAFEQSEAIEPTELEAFDQESDIPDWLRDLGAGSLEQQPAPEESNFAVKDESQDDQVPPAESLEADKRDAGEHPPATRQPVSLSAPGDDWNSSPTGKNLIQDGDLSWLQELEAAFPEAPSVENVIVNSEFHEVEPEGVESSATGFDSELSDWLSEANAQEMGLPDHQSPGAPEAGGDIQPASLPAWLEAMRPIEALGHPGLEGETTIENVGPLAGLGGVLRAEPDILSTKPPPAYSVKLRPTELQLSHANLLEHLLDTEGEAKPVPANRVVSFRQLLHTMIFTVLMLAVTLPILFGFSLGEPPIYSPEAFEANQLIDNLPSGAPVLMAIDYEPGFSGEMDAIAAAVLDHLMLKGALITMVSSVPTGPLQAERLIARANQAGAHQYAAPGQYINLGYIPGGQTGLMSFAASPRQTLASDLWAESPAKNFQGLSSYAMVLVATESSNRARSWIEQVQPRLGGTPLILLTSAQIEPVVKPYYGGSQGQIQGLVVGLAGGASYERLLGRSGIASAGWSPFSLGILIGIFWMVVGGGYYIGRRGLTKLRTQAGEEETP